MTPGSRKRKKKPRMTNSMWENLEKGRTGSIARGRWANPKDVAFEKARKASLRDSRKKKREKEREKKKEEKARKADAQALSREEKARKAMIVAESQKAIASLNADLLSSWTPDERDAWRYLPQTEKRKIAAELLMKGLDCKTASLVVWGNEGALYGWLSKHTKEFHQLMKTEMTQDALLEVPATWGKLKSLRESPNWETSRKAVLDCLRAAGVGVDTPASNPQTINIQAENVQMNQTQNLTVQELDQRILDLARGIGDPEAIQLVEAEIKGGKGESKGKGSDRAGGETRETQPAPSTPEGTKREENKPSP